MIPSWLQPAVDAFRSHWESAKRISQEPFADIAKRWWDSWLSRPLVSATTPTAKETNPRKIWMRRAVALGVLLFMVIGLVGTAEARLGDVPEINPGAAVGAASLLVGSLLMFFDSLRSRE